MLFGQSNIDDRIRGRFVRVSKSILVDQPQRLDGETKRLPKSRHVDL